MKDYLLKVSEGNGAQPVVHSPDIMRMFKIPGYSKSNFSDNVVYFHGREIRKVKWAEGGRGFVFQLSLAEGDDEEGWTEAERVGYDGWGKDVGRQWRNGEALEREGVPNFREKFGQQAFSLNHR